MAEARTEVGPPRWVYVWFVVVSLIVVAAGIFVAIRAQSATDLAKDNTRILESNQMSSARADCRSAIGAARRDVLDQLNLLLDVDRTVHDQILGEGINSFLQGARPSEDQQARYVQNNADLDADRKLAQSLVPNLPSVDEITDHGGLIPVLHPDRTVTQQRFDACPKVSG